MRKIIGNHLKCERLARMVCARGSRTIFSHYVLKLITLIHGCADWRDEVNENAGIFKSISRTGNLDEVDHREHWQC